MINKIITVFFILMGCSIGCVSASDTIFSMVDDQVYISRDSGKSWSGIYVESATTVKYNYMCFDTANRLVYAATNTCLLKSSDGGKHWTKIFPSGTQEPVNRIAVSLDGTSSIYAVTLDGLYTSSNNGKNWKPLSLPSRQGYFIQPFRKENKIYLAGGQNAYLSRDNGITWNSISKNIPESISILDMAVNPQNSLQVYIASAEGLFYSGNGGKHWKKKNISSKDWIQTTKIIYSNTNPAILYALDNDVKESGISYLRKSSDGGNTWRLIASKENIQLFTINYNNPSMIYYSYTSSMAVSGIESALSSIVKSVDGGSKWTSIEAVMPGYSRARLMLLRPW